MKKSPTKKQLIDLNKEEFKGNSKKKKEKVWILEYKWNSEQDFNKYPKPWFSNKVFYSSDWQKEGLWGNKHSSIEAAKDSLKSQLRSVFQSKYLEGRQWRVVNIQTNEEFYFMDILNYYK